jgi:hypothetical protein
MLTADVSNEGRGNRLLDPPQPRASYWPAVQVAAQSTQVVSVAEPQIATAYWPARQSVHGEQTALAAAPHARDV